MMMSARVIEESGRSRVMKIVAGSLVVGIGAVLGSCGGTDPVHDQNVQALGGEVDGIPANDFHRAGQPCVICHSADGPAKTIFSVAGTVFTNSEQQGGLNATGACGVNVLLVDSNGAQATAVTNCVGNFWLSQDAYNPAFPLKVGLTNADGSGLNPMLSRINRDGSCGKCHQSPPYAGGAGRVYQSGNNPPASCANCPVNPPVVPCAPGTPGGGCFIPGALQ